MRTTDAAAFQRLMTDAMAFWKSDLSEFALSVWWQACQNYDLEQVTKAISAHAMDPEQGRFAPKPADIVKHLQGTRTDRSLLAWGKVLEAMARVGSWNSVAFDDAAIHAAIEDMGGWCALCATTTDELPFVQRRFCDTHKAYTSRPETPPHVPVLRGQHDANNARLGILQKPVLVGDQQKALAIATGAGKERARIGVAQMPAQLRIAAHDEV